MIDGDHPDLLLSTVTLKKVDIEYIAEGQFIGGAKADGADGDDRTDSSIRSVDAVDTAGVGKDSAPSERQDGGEAGEPPAGDRQPESTPKPSRRSRTLRTYRDRGGATAK